MKCRQLKTFFNSDPKVKKKFELNCIITEFTPVGQSHKRRRSGFVILLVSSVKVPNKRCGRTYGSYTKKQPTLSPMDGCGEG